MQYTSICFEIAQFSRNDMDIGSEKITLAETCLFAPDMANLATANVYMSNLNARDECVKSTNQHTRRHLKIQKKNNLHVIKYCWVFFFVH